MDSHLVHFTYGRFSEILVSNYAYMLDFENNPTAATQTLGIRFKVLYTVEYATQNDYGDGAASNDADYFLGELGGSLKSVTVKVSCELLGEDGTVRP